MKNRALCLRLLAICSLILVSGALAQKPVFQPILTGHEVTAAVTVDGRIYAGLAKGGVIEWEIASQAHRRYLDRSDGLSGHFVQDMTWSGSRLLVAYADGGITAINDPGGDAEFMQLYRDGLADLAITCVTAQQIGSSERIYYGTVDNGIGVIDGGREGAYYSTLEGLIDDSIDAIAMSGDLLLVATPVGVSRFADNAFTNYSYADTGWEVINDLEVDGEGRIWAGTATGVKRWDDENRTWIDVYGTGPFIQLARVGPAMAALNAFGDAVRIEGNSAPTLVMPTAAEGESFVITAIMAVGDDIWVGGRTRRDEFIGSSLVAQPWIAPTGDADQMPHDLPTCRVGVGGGFDGVTFDADNRLWVADRAGDGIAGWDGATWYNIDRVGTEENGFQGLYDYSGSILTMTAGGDDIWFYQYTVGALRLRPAAAPGGEETWERVNRGTSGMLTDGAIVVETHPDGAIFFCSDASSWWGGAPNELLGVDVLFDPQNPLDQSSWYHVPVDSLDGNLILAVGFERRDVVWFSVQNSGLKRWDINGLGAGPEDPLTWDDPTDDHWSPVLLDAGGEITFETVNTICAGSDGSIWAGGAGLTRFTYSPTSGVTLLGEWTQKEQTFEPGLLGQAVRGLEFDHNGDLWILSEGGLDRFRLGDAGIEVDSFTDLVTYGGLDQRFYSSGVIAPLPGGSYRELTRSADGRHLALTSDLGAVMVDVPSRAATGEEALAALYLYPNPFPGDGTTGRIGLGGLEVDGNSPVSIEVLNLVGQIVYQNDRVTDATGFWDGRNRLGERVASGLYVVKVAQGGAVRVTTLAVAF